MTLSTIANSLAAMIFVISGVAALINPGLFARLVGWIAESRGTAEIRINVGALWLGAGLAALVMQSPDVFRALGAGWLCIAVCRIMAYLLDKPSETRFYWLLLVGEIITAVLFLV